MSAVETRLARSYICLRALDGAGGNARRSPFSAKGPCLRRVSKNCFARQLDRTRRVIPFSCIETWSTLLSNGFPPKSCVQFSRDWAIHASSLPRPTSAPAPTPALDPASASTFAPPCPRLRPHFCPRPDPRPTHSPSPHSPPLPTWLGKVFDFSSGMCRRAVGGTAESFIKEARYSVSSNEL